MKRSRGNFGGMLPTFMVVSFGLFAFFFFTVKIAWLTGEREAHNRIQEYAALTFLAVYLTPPPPGPPSHGVREANAVTAADQVMQLNFDSLPVGAFSSAAVTPPAYAIRYGSWDPSNTPSFTDLGPTPSPNSVNALEVNYGSRIGSDKMMGKLFMSSNDIDVNIRVVVAARPGIGIAVVARSTP